VHTTYIASMIISTRYMNCYSANAILHPHPTK
jgi:hypothetical protein